ncbi:MAG: hypothetical protein HY550_05170 [Elusimicrobia bacterium]|nr:hypothetical protein [Elusimicrobiota bacterium]
MNDPKTDAMREWVARWRKTGPELERIRLQELRQVVVGSSIEQLEDSFQSALLNYPARTSSGLIEQQRWFMRLRR